MEEEREESFPEKLIKGFIYILVLILLVIVYIVYGIGFLLHVILAYIMGNFWGGIVAGIIMGPMAAFLMLAYGITRFPISQELDSKRFWDRIKILRKIAPISMFILEFFIYTSSIAFGIIYGIVTFLYNQSSPKTILDYDYFGWAIFGLIIMALIWFLPRWITPFIEKAMEDHDIYWHIGIEDKKDYYK